MPAITVLPLREDLGFGAIIHGVTQSTLSDPGVRQQINDVFEDRGLVLFENVEPSSEMHLALSDVFGPLKTHPVPAVKRVDEAAMPGVIDMHYRVGMGNVVEIDGQRRASWLPWHFDHCYNDELNRAGVLRAIDTPPELGMTGFADGVQLYDDLSPALRARIADKTIIYRLDTLYENLRFGRPQPFAVIETKNASAIQAFGDKLPRALHPAVWRRGDGRQVLHVSPWMAQGIEGMENAEGDALLEAVCQEIAAKAKSYFHKWRPTDMLIWDNWRVLHAVTGHDPSHDRRMQRTTIKGDYGLGRFENNAEGHRILADTEV